VTFTPQPGPKQVKAVGQTGRVGHINAVGQLINVGGGAACGAAA
jgi:hypothetical protein